MPVTVLVTLLVSIVCDIVHDVDHDNAFDCLLVADHKGEISNCIWHTHLLPQHKLLAVGGVTQTTTPQARSSHQGSSS